MKFSIRELMVLTLAVAMGVAWLAERKRLRDALDDVKDAEQKVQEADLKTKQMAETARIFALQAKSSQERSKIQEEQISQIEKQLPAHGVDLWLQGDTGHSGPVVKRRYPAH